MLQLSFRYQTVAGKIYPYHAVPAVIKPGRDRGVLKTCSHRMQPPRRGGELHVISKIITWGRFWREPGATFRADLTFRACL